MGFRFDKGCGLMVRTLSSLSCCDNCTSKITSAPPGTGHTRKSKVRPYHYHVTMTTWFEIK